MAPFASRSFAATLPNSIAARYRKALIKHPFLLFGFPFLTTIVAGSFMLTPATALRYERYDRKNQQITHEQAMGLGQDRRKVNMKDEYYVSRIHVSGAMEKRRGKRLRTIFWNFLGRSYITLGDVLTVIQRLQAKDLENWEQRRVKRLPGEVDGILE